MNRRCCRKALSDLVSTHRLTCRVSSTGRFRRAMETVCAPAWAHRPFALRDQSSLTQRRCGSPIRATLLSQAARCCSGLPFPDQYVRARESAALPELSDASTRAYESGRVPSVFCAVRVGARKSLAATWRVLSCAKRRCRV